MARIAYLDESGIGAIRNDPVAVVAGIIVNPDTQMKRIENRLLEIKQESSACGREVILHAVDIFHRNKDFDKAQFSIEQSKEMLHKIASIPREFDLPVVVGCVNRAPYEERFNEGTPTERIAYVLSVASMQCSVVIEAHMREDAEKDEVCILVYENNAQSKRHIRETHNHLRTEASLSISKFFPFQRIIEAPLFAEKEESALLQVADVLAFVFARKASGKSDCDSLVDLIKPKVVEVDVS